MLFSIAYRMLGSASDADDVLQDAWLRYRGVDRSSIREPKALATTIVTRLCLDRMKSARATREEYIGPWLPEPILTSPAAHPDAMLQRTESITLAFLVLLEKLSPEERAVFLLKDVFEYEHSEIAGMIGVSMQNSRQLLHRAKERLANGKPRLTGSAPSRRAIAERFTRAFASADAPDLAALLAKDVGVWTDGGGKASAARRPIVGRERVLNFLVGLHRTAQTSGSAVTLSLTVDEINAEPALIIRNAERLEAIYVFTIDGDTILGIRIIRNPDKLARVERQLAKSA
jgi:RNA polymerase sigma factor (sigma-70 family)